jgi:riboflavin biosynthesis pyrimidine reductase
MAKAHGLNATKLAEAVESVAYKDSVIGFDAPAYKSGVFNVPTFYIGGERYAEQPYVVLLDAVKAAKKAYVKHPYESFTFPAAPDDRPYTIIDMVTTIDGKSVSGARGEPVDDLGSKTDHGIMRHLQDVADGVLIGAGTLRASPGNWNPKTKFRVVVSGSGKVDTEHAFFKGGEGYIATPEAGNFLAANGVRPLIAGKKNLKIEKVLRELREKGCQKLLVLGGSSTNAELLQVDLVDEIFLTIAPKVKLGEGLPTLAGGKPLPREAMLRFKLVEHFEVGDEIFLRYRRVGKR